MRFDRFVAMRFANVDVEEDLRLIRDEYRDAQTQCFPSFDG